MPESHRDLLARPIHAVLATVLPSGFPQAHVVWCGFDGTEVLTSTTLERAKGRNMAARPQATVLAVDPSIAPEQMTVRGDVEITQDDTVEVADQLTRLYTKDGWITVRDAVSDDPAALRLITRLSARQRRRWTSSPAASQGHPEPGLLPHPDR